MTTERSKLADCPFCGGKAYAVQSGPPDGRVVGCGKCSARTVSDFKGCAERDWNARAAPSPDTRVPKVRTALPQPGAVEPEELEALICDRSANRAADAILAEFVLTRRALAGKEGA